MELTHEQLAICEAAKAGGDKLALKIQAFAGTGKTTTLAAIAEACPRQRFLYVVFNRAAADSARARMPSNVEARTAHSIAFRKIGWRYESRLTQRPWAWLPFMREKMPRALNAVAAGGRTRSAAGAVIIKTLEHFIRSAEREVSLDHVPSWCDVPLARTAADAAADLWNAIRDPNGSSPVSHDCYLKMFFLGDHQMADANRTLLLDEAQDADPIILGLFERHAGPRVLVGDSYQQLYQWRGAVNALGRISVDAAAMPLTQTFRFGNGAARWANRVLELLEEKHRIAPATHPTSAAVSDNSREVDAILTRTNAGALDEAVKALEHRRKVYVMGGAEALVRLIESAWKLKNGKKGSGELAVFSTWDELKSAAEGNRSGDDGDPSLKILVKLIEERGPRVLAMCARLRECVESPETADVTVSTVHKAKGLEWPRVLVGADFNRFIRREYGVVKRDHEEACVIYVALTRARQQLLIHPECVKELKASSDALNPEVGNGKAPIDDATAVKLASATAGSRVRSRRSGPSAKARSNVRSG
ncbi:MAG TPA: 3'-5' exonuclease [Candidatus Binataceae bacterium]|nr:3'-5' exonuclease [Candidatus Binataceae bacterium]